MGDNVNEHYWDLMDFAKASHRPFVGGCSTQCKNRSNSLNRHELRRSVMDFCIELLSRSLFALNISYMTSVLASALIKVRITAHHGTEWNENWVQGNTSGRNIQSTCH